MSVTERWFPQRPTPARLFDRVKVMAVLCFRGAAVTCLTKMLGKFEKEF